jgi:hypothetical protein
MRAFMAVLLLATLGLAACDKPGPAERTGRSLDRAGERVRDAVDPPGPTERVGRAVDRALN